MPKDTKNSDKKKKAETMAIWKTTTLYIVFGSLVFALFWWARTDGQSEVAWKVRNLLGIQLLEEALPEPAPEPVSPVIEPEPVVEPEPIAFEPPETTEPEPPEAPEPEALKWAAFKDRTSMWPDSLQIMVDQEVTLTYRGNSYGEVSFNSGQALDVIGFSENGYVFGRSIGNEIEVHVSETNFGTWFESEHGALYEITYPERERISQPSDFDQELITQLRIWCLKKYNTPLIEINEKNLVLRIDPKGNERSSGSYALEAMSVARAYLRIQAELGGSDTYASCEIRHSGTGKLLGSKGIFIPRF